MVGAGIDILCIVFPGLSLSDQCVRTCVKKTRGTTGFPCDKGTLAAGFFIFFWFLAGALAIGAVLALALALGAALASALGAALAFALEAALAFALGAALAFALGAALEAADHRLRHRADVSWTPACQLTLEN